MLSIDYMSLAIFSFHLNSIMKIIEVSLSLFLVYSSELMKETVIL